MEAAGKIFTGSLLLNLALFLPCLSAAVSSNLSSSHPSMPKGPIHHDKLSYTHVERHCQSVLSSAAELSTDPDDAGVLKYKLSFVNGDWTQDAGQAPLLPSHGSYAADAAAAGPESLGGVPLASFMLLHMDMDTVPRRGSRTAFHASGMLSLTITRRNCCCSYMEPSASQYFELRPGVARLLVWFQGVYTETKSSASGGGGERVLCMVGERVFPVPCTNGAGPREDWASFKPPVTADGNILLVLRYPMATTLATRAVRGEMTSTSAESDGAYFDPVRLVSQLAGGYSFGYQFQREAPGCRDEPPLSHDGDAMDQQLSSGAASLCDIINRSAPDHQAIMEVVPNWDCKGTDAFCGRLGPFATASRPAASATEEDTAFTRSAILVQGLTCGTTATGADGAAARVAAVLRYVPPWEDLSVAAKRTGLSGATLSAEGAWDASTGRACMAGCLGAGEGACRYRVTLSVRTALSLTRRGSIVGRITAVDGSHAPLLFQQRVSLRRLGSSGETPRMSYTYTKVEQARELLIRASEATGGFRDNFVAKSVLSYPNVVAGAAADDMAGPANLAGNLNLRFQGVVRPPFVPEWIEEPCFELQILSIGTLVVAGSYSPQLQAGRPGMWNELLGRVHGVEKQPILNVSAEFTASRNNLVSPIPVMSLEGVYNPDDGRMYLIGCRKVHAPWRVLSKHRDLEDGRDCSVEVTVEYPPTTTRWLMVGQTATVSIVSTREEDDPLRFARTELRTVPVTYRDQRCRWDGVMKPIVDGLLCITLLSAIKIILVPVQ